MSMRPGASLPYPRPLVRIPLDGFESGAKTLRVTGIPRAFSDAAGNHGRAGARARRFATRNCRAVRAA